MSQRTPTFTVRVFVFPGVRLLHVTGPIEVFTSANDFGGRYQLRLVSEDGRDVVTSGRTRLGVDRSVGDVDDQPCDALIIPGGPEWERLIKDDAFLGVVRRLTESARCTASVCTGAFLLAAAGLLDGRRATTHWRDAAQLALRFPAVQVESDAIFVQDGHLMTSAGVSAGIDLSLAIVEKHVHDRLGGLRARLGQRRARRAARCAGRQPLRAGDRARPEERARAMAVWSGLAGVGAAFGVMLSGVLTDLASWRWIFFINLPIAAVVIALTPRLVSETRASRRGRPDIAGAALITLGLLSIVLGLLEKGTHGWLSFQVLGWVLIGFALLIGFTLVEARAAQPLVPLGFLRSRNRSVANAVRVCYYVGFATLFFSRTAATRPTCCPG